jgi:hypothetical protein
LSEAWKRLDLGGAGLQRANLELAARLKRRKRAWALLAGAPLGLHRNYLDDAKGARVWRIATVAALAAALWDLRLAAAVGAALVAALAYDAWWIDRRVTALNKRIRREIFRAGEAPPPGYSGREIDPPSPSVPSFAEQERLLREAARRGAPPGPAPGAPPGPAPGAPPGPAPGAPPGPAPGAPPPR